MKAQVTVQVTAEVAQALHRKAPPTADSRELSRLLEEYGAVLEALHTDTEDPGLLSWFTVEAPDQASAERILDRLQRRRAVRAAYIKPQDALP